MTEISLDAISDLSAVSKLFDALKPDTPTTLDPSNPTHRAGIEAALAAAGRTGARYPHLHDALDKGSAGTASLTLIDKGIDSGGRATAMAWQASGAGHAYSGATLFALDGDSGTLLALGHNANVGEGFVPVSTDTPSARKAGSKLKVLAVGHSVAHSGAASFTALASTSQVTTDTDANIVVDEPTTTPKYPPDVRIALGRTSTSADVDYWYAEPQNIQNPYLIVPFAGNATLPYDIDGTLGQPINGAVYLTKIYFSTNSGTNEIPMNATYTKNFTEKVTVDTADQGKVVWSYPYGQGGSYTSTESIVYDPQSLVNETESYFYYSFQIPVQNAPTPNFSFAICSYNTPNEPSFQCHQICNLWFWWHCLAAGTQVMLVDGHTMAIDDIDNTHRVRTGMRDQDLAVEATSRGAHKAAASEPSVSMAVHELSTEGGHTLVATGAHVIATPEGMVPLADLNPGDAVLTPTGPVKVKSRKAIDYDGMMFNLKVADEADRRAGFGDSDIGTYIANGIVVGDKFAQRNAARQRNRDIARVKTTLADPLVTDYASAIEDIRY
ncbi:Hint domain-containing protein [Breoghania sp. JC706]|uniref:Hint domain-containing protein n=1 Tax=Breoghania sp. JC706 TaxID=3117732 RepID=UPI003009967B